LIGLARQRGTLTRVLKLVFGAQQIGKASDGDMKRGWNDFLLGKLIMEADEFRGDGGKYNLNEYIKRETTYPAVLINRRNTTPYEIRNIPNWMFHVHDGVSHRCGSKALTMRKHRA
jgi:hypothetical protein